MVPHFNGQAIPATLVIEPSEGKLAGTWKSQGMEMELTGLAVAENVIRFERTMGPGGASMAFEGTLDGDTLDGAFEYGRELECTGKRSKP